MAPLNRVTPLFAALLAIGCGEVPKGPELAPAVEVVFADARDPVHEERFSFIPAVWLPLWPWEGRQRDPSVGTSHWPELREALLESGLFGEVLGPGDATLERQAAPWVAHVTMLDTWQGTTRTTYGLGIFGHLLHLLGAPWEYTTSRARLRIACGPRGEAAKADEISEAAALELDWLLEGELPESIDDGTWPDREADMREAVREAVLDALAPLRH